MSINRRRWTLTIRGNLECMRWTIGIDEVGRGCLAGPVAVGVCMVAENFDNHLLEGIRDSKQLSEKKREAWYESLRMLQREGTVSFTVSMVSSRVIDRIGIVASIQRALDRGLTKTTRDIDPIGCRILLDGGLHAHSRFLNQITIIKGDQTEPLISAASIVAKVTRDRLLKRVAKRYPWYGFEKHKGYGTAFHRMQIGTYGLSQLHRASFCRNLLLS